MGKCGSGVVIYKDILPLDNQNPITLERNVSQYSAPYYGELMAIKIALQECVFMNLNSGTTIHIFSDCQSAITAITNNKPADSHQTEINEVNKIAIDFVYKQHQDCNILDRWTLWHCWQ